MALEKNISINVETGKAKKEFKDLGGVIQEQKDITIEFEKELRALESQLANTSKGSLAAQKALKDQISTLKNALKDQRISLKDLNNEKSKAKVLNESYTDGLSKTTGVVTYLNQATGGLAGKFIDVARAAKLSGKAMKAALISSGIGVAVALIALIVEYWDDIVGSIEDANAKLEEQNRLLERNKSALLSKLRLNQQFIDQAIKEGKNVDDLVKKRGELITSLQKELLAKQQLILAKRDEALLDAKKLTFEERVAQKRETGKVVEGTGVVTPEELKIIDEYNAELDKLTESLTQLGFESTNLGDIGKEKPKKEKKENVKPPEILGVGGIFEDTDALEAKTERIKEFYQQIQDVDDYYWLQGIEREISDIERKAQADIEELRSLGAQKELIEEIERQSAEKIAGIAKKAAEDRAKATSKTEIKWTELTAAQKLAITGSLLGDLAGLVDKNSIAGKGIAIAQTGINTAQGIMQAFATLPTVPAIVAAALVGATGIAQTIKIAKTKIPSATGSGFVGGGVGGGGGAPKPPAFNLVQGTKSNQIADSVQSGTQPVKAYVTSKDVTSRQEMDRNIEGGASL